MSVWNTLFAPKTNIVSLSKIKKYYCAILSNMENNELFETIFKHTANNEIEILTSENCSCVFCRHTYSARLVKDWVSDNKGTNAICPNCGIDSVVGDSSGYTFDKEELKQINLYFFGEDYMKKNPRCLVTYVNRFKAGKITFNEKNENLFKEYCKTLAGFGNIQAAYDLGFLYDTGSEFTERDALKALECYSNPDLLCEPTTLVRAGLLYKSGRLASVYDKKAYECFAKSSALGSMEGAIHYFDCYLDGTFVDKDEYFAFVGYSKLWGESYRRFLMTTGRETSFLPQISYRIGVMFMDSKGVPHDDLSALKMFLLSAYAFEIVRGDKAFTKPEDAEDYDDVCQRIELLSRKYAFAKAEPVFDDDTFFDSFTDAKAADFHIMRKCKFIPKRLDEDEATFSFVTESATPFLIIDHKSLFCSFVNSPITWTFSSIEEAVYGDADSFDFATGDLESGWIFTRGDGADMVNVATIIYQQTEKDEVVEEDGSESLS